jgi:flavin reductase (DIM6/NTAB) family NADH-FMN oxidoreductase RutF
MQREDTPGAFDARAFRDALGSFATGVAVAATRARDGAPVGLTINSFSSVSLDPPLVLWSIDLRSGSLSAFRDAQAFSINILSDKQTGIARRFAEPGVCRFGETPCDEGALGVPVLRDALAVIECQAEARHPGGDHEIIIGRAARISHAVGRKPLLFWRGRFRALAAD